MSASDTDTNTVALWGTDQPVVADLSFWNGVHADALERIRVLEAALAKEDESKSVLVVRRSRFPNHPDQYMSVPVSELPLGVRLACERPPEERLPRVHALSDEKKDAVRFRRESDLDDDDDDNFCPVYVNWIADVDSYGDHSKVFLESDLRKTLRDHAGNAETAFVRAAHIVARLVGQYGRDDEWRKTIGAGVCEIHRDDVESYQFYAADPETGIDSIVDEWDNVRKALSACVRAYAEEMKPLLERWTGDDAERNFGRIPANKKFLAVFYV